jgi:hypothetical protein
MRERVSMQWCRISVVAGAVFGMSALTRGQASPPDSNPENIEDVTAESEVQTQKPLLTIERPFYNALQAKKQQWKEKYGLELAVAYTTIYQITSGGIDHNSAAASTFSIYSLWKFIRDPDGVDGTGLGFQFENRADHTSDQFPEMTRDLGTLWSPNDSSSDNYSQIKQLWLATRFADGMFTLQAGKIDPTAYINKNRFAGSDKSQFFSQPLATNPARGFPSNGLGIQGRFVPTKWMYIHGVVSDSDADSNYSPFKTINGNWIYAGEVGFTPDVPNLGAGNYAFTVYQRNTDGNTGSGFALSVAQDLGPKYGVFLRYAVQNGEFKPSEQILATGLSFLRPFGRTNDQAGVGISWTRPDDHDLRDEYAGEIYYRLQLTDGIELSASTQLIKDPSDSEKDWEAVYGMRVRFLY